MVPDRVTAGRSVQRILDTVTGGAGRDPNPDRLDRRRVGQTLPDIEGSDNCGQVRPIHRAVNTEPGTSIHPGENLPYPPSTLVPCSGVFRDDVEYLVEFVALEGVPFLGEDRPEFGAGLRKQVGDLVRNRLVDEFKLL